MPAHPAPRENHHVEPTSILPGPPCSDGSCGAPGSTEGGGRADGINEAFRHFAHRTSCIVGTPGAFLAALLVLVGWGISGPIFKFSDTWQLVINTGTTIITFLMVFVIQSTQNRDASALHLKLDELIRATHSARNDLVALEQMSDVELRNLEQQFQALRKRAVESRTKADDAGKPPRSHS